MNSGDKKESQLLSNFYLTEDNLSNEAKDRFPFHTEILNSLNLCSQHVLANKSLTPAGRHILCSKIIRKHENVKSVLNYVASTSAQSKEKITEVPMIVICGIPRTGTTLLHNLMACDLACRAPQTTDMVIHPIPPIPRSNITEHKRRMKSETYFQAKIFETAGCNMKQYAKNRSSSHADFDYEEDAVLQEEVGVQCLFSILAPRDTNLVTWFADNENKDFAYEYHKTVLQMLHDVDPPETHWQLKSPMHILWIDTLLKYYPNASLIMSHRPLDEVVPSVCRFFVAYNSIYFNRGDSDSLKQMIEQTLRLFHVWVERLVEFRTRQPPLTNVCDIQYKDLMNDPIGTVRRIYEHFDFLQWSDPFEKAMRTWIIDNPQGKQGRHSYSLDQFGLTYNDTKATHKKYEDMFLS